jgi:probable phosphoglycerate mutase
MMFKIQSMSRLMKLVLPIVLITSFSGPALCQQPLVVFLVRHAEKVDASENPKLSTAGKARALTVAKTLRDADIQYVHSTDFIRTKKTAAPIATKSGVKVELYEAADLPALVGQLKGKGGRHLVVGHSNTTPKLVALLGGEPGPKIQEMEYDRLYMITIGKDGDASTVLIRFGEAFASESPE